MPKNSTRSKHLRKTPNAVPGNGGKPFKPTSAFSADRSAASSRKANPPFPITQRLSVRAAILVLFRINTLLYYFYFNKPEGFCQSLLFSVSPLFSQAYRG